MKFDQYQALCTEAIGLLSGDSKAVTKLENESLQLEEVTIDLVFDEPQSVLSVVCHLGEPAEEYRTQVYEQLLYLQMLSLHMPGVRFGYDPKRDEVLFCSSTQVNESATAAWLAQLITTMVQQVDHWRSDMLSGQMAKDAADMAAELMDQ